MRGENGNETRARMNMTRERKDYRRIDQRLIFRLNQWSIFGYHVLLLLMIPSVI